MGGERKVRHVFQPDDRTADRGEEEDHVTGDEAEVTRDEIEEEAEENCSKNEEVAVDDEDENNSNEEEGEEDDGGCRQRQPRTCSRGSERSDYEQWKITCYCHTQRMINLSTATQQQGLQL